MRVSSIRPTVAAPECGCGKATQARAEIGEHIPLASAILIALLPKCPLCLAAWLGIIGSTSISSWVNRVWGAPLTAGFLSIAIGTIARRAWHRSDSRPLWLGLLGGAALLYGKCIVNVSLLLFAGLGLMIVAAFWRHVASVRAKIPTWKFALFSPDRRATTPPGAGSSFAGRSR